VRANPLDPELRDLISQARSHAGLRPVPNEDSVEHDYREQGWGHACSLSWDDRGHQYTGLVISQRPLHLGDVIRLDGGRIVLIDVNRMLDPDDNYEVMAKVLKDEVAALYFKEHP
jgi:hypothetical protein